MSTDAINPNVPVTNPTTNESGKLEVESGGGPATFAELESVMSAKKGRPKNQDLTTDDRKGEPKSEKKDAKPEPKKDDEKADKKPAKAEASDKEEQKPPRKTYKGKYQDQEYELDEEAEFLVKTNGKDEPWKLKDLLADRSGRTAWDKKFTEIDKKDKAVIAREEKIKQISETFKSLATEQDPDMKLFKMAQIAGTDPVQFRKQFMDVMQKNVENYSMMTDAEKQAADLAFENKVYKQRADTLQSQRDQEEADRALKSQIDQAIASHQISGEEFDQKVDYLDQQVRLGKLDKSHLTIENAVQLVKIDRLWKPAAEAFDALKLSMEPEERSQVLQNVVKNALAIGLDPKDIPSVIDEVYGSKRAQKILKEKQQQNQEFTTGKRDVPVNTPKTTSEPTFFSDI